MTETGWPLIPREVLPAPVPPAKRPPRPPQTVDPSRQLPIFGAGTTEPSPADLAGLLAGPGRLGRMGGTARVSVPVDAAWRVHVLAAELVTRGLVVHWRPIDQDPPTPAPAPDPHLDPASEDPTNEDRANPNPADPDPADPDPADPDPADPDPADPDPADPDPADPDPTNPDPADPDPTDPDLTNPDPADPDPADLTTEDQDPANPEPAADQYTENQDQEDQDPGIRAADPSAEEEDQASPPGSVDEGDTPGSKDSEEPGSPSAPRFEVLTAYSSRLNGLARAWPEAAAQLFLSGPRLRLWVAAAGEPVPGGYALGLDPAKDQKAVDAALVRAGLAGRVSDDNRQYLIMGKRRLARLAELVGERPAAAPEELWPGGALA